MRSPISSSRTPAGADGTGSTRAQNTRLRRGRRRSVVAGTIIAVGAILGAGLAVQTAMTAQPEPRAIATAPTETTGIGERLAIRGDVARLHAAQRAARARAEADRVAAAEAADEAAEEAAAAEADAAADAEAAAAAAEATAAAEAEAAAAAADAAAEAEADATAPSHPANQRGGRDRP